jgi:hypothetical protein
MDKTISGTDDETYAIGTTKLFYLGISGFTSDSDFHTP